MRWLLAGAVAGLGALVAFGGGGAAAADKPPTRTCKQRVEGGEPNRFSRPGNFIVGRISLSGLARYSDPGSLDTAWDPQRRIYHVKAGATVRAGRNVKLSIVPAQRSAAGLSYAADGRTATPGEQPVVLFSPCRAGEPSFSGNGTVGRVTGFTGGIAFTAPMCLTLEARARGRAPVRRTVSLGMGDSCTQP